MNLELNLIERLIEIMGNRDKLKIGKYYIERYITNDSVENFIITDLMSEISIYVEYDNEGDEYQISMYDSIKSKWIKWKDVDVYEILKEIIYSVVIE